MNVLRAFMPILLATAVFGCGPAEGPDALNQRPPAQSTTSFADPECSACHAVPTNLRRQILGSAGDFSANASILSHHVVGSEPTKAQCRVCHDFSAHGSGVVILRHADTGAGIIYDPANPATLEPFCLSCHDTNGADGNMNPFSDGIVMGAGMYKASSTIQSSWNMTYGHNQKGLTCIGNGNPNTGCHAGGHGSTHKGLLSMNMTLPLPGGYRANDYELCFNCHAAYPAATKEVIFGVRQGGRYDGTYGPRRSSDPLTITFHDASNTISRESGSFIADGFNIGNQVRTNSVYPANQGPFLIANLTDSVLTVTTLALGDPALTTGVELTITVRSNNPPYYTSGIMTKLRDQNNQFSVNIYDDNNANINFWLSGSNFTNQHWFHITLQGWNYRDTTPSGLSCMACHNVHGTNSQWSMTYDEMQYMNFIGSGSDRYAKMGATTPYTLNLFPISCNFRCHDSSLSVGFDSSAWFEPANE